MNGTVAKELSGTGVKEQRDTEAKEWRSIEIKELSDMNGVSEKGEIYADNPILPGFYPDPSICRVGEDYYMVNSTFAYFPGIPVFHSRNLGDWEQIGNVLTRNSQVQLAGCGHSEGIYAPTIRYHEEIYYVIATNVSGGGNFIVAAGNPAGPWSDPVYLGDQAKGIDPSLFFDEDGSCWYIGQRERTGGGDYFGDCEIWVRKLDLEKLNQSLAQRMPTYHKAADSEGKFDSEELQMDKNRRNKVNRLQKSTLEKSGSEDTACADDLFLGEDFVLSYGFARKAVWAEGPHLYKKDGYYYLIHAEMGTEQNHCVVVARSRELTGPYEYSRANPILTHRHLGKTYPVTCVGHADLVDDGKGRWYMVMLASRPVEGHTLMGRETFLAKAEWEDEWPVVNPGVGRLEDVVLLPEPGKQDSKILLSEPAPKCKFPPEFLMLRNPEPDTIKLLDDGTVRLYMKASTLKDKAHPAYLCVRQQHKAFTVETRLQMYIEQKAEEHSCAGLAYVQSNEAHICMECVKISGKLWIRVISCEGGVDTELAKTEIGSEVKKVLADVRKTSTAPEGIGGECICLRIHVNGMKADFAWKINEKSDLAVEGEWNTIIADVDLRHMSTETAGGFVGCTVGMYASSNGARRSGYAEFTKFMYSGANSRM